jgi:hypothetical protein
MGRHIRMSTHYDLKGHHGRDCMVVGFTTTYAIFETRFQEMHESTFRQVDH